MHNYNILWFSVTRNMDVDYDYDADPFADLDYDDLVKWAAEHRLDEFHFRWLNIKGFDAVLRLSITLFSTI